MKKCQKLLGLEHRKRVAKGRAEGMAKGIAEGRAEGIAKGRAEGIAEANLETARKLSMLMSIY